MSHHHSLKWAHEVPTTLLVAATSGAHLSAPPLTSTTIAISGVEVIASFWFHWQFCDAF